MSRLTNNREKVGGAGGKGRGHLVEGVGSDTTIGGPLASSLLQPASPAVVRVPSEPSAAFLFSADIAVVLSILRHEHYHHQRNQCHAQAWHTLRLAAVCLAVVVSW